MNTLLDRSHASLCFSFGLLALVALGCGGDSKSDSKDTDTKGATAMPSGAQGAALVALKKKAAEVGCDCYGSQKQDCMDGLWPAGSDDCMAEVYDMAARDVDGFKCAEEATQKQIDCFKASDCDETAQEECFDEYYPALYGCLDSKVEDAALECIGGTVEE